MGEGFNLNSNIFVTLSGDCTNVSVTSTTHFGHVPYSPPSIVICAIPVHSFDCNATDYKVQSSSQIYSSRVYLHHLSSGKHMIGKNQQTGGCKGLVQPSFDDERRLSKNEI